MHYVYCDTAGEAIETPDFNDAKRAFYRFVRENPSERVEWDHDDLDGTRKRVMCCDPS